MVGGAEPGSSGGRDSDSKTESGFLCQHFQAQAGLVEESPSAPVSHLGNDGTARFIHRPVG